MSARQPWAAKLTEIHLRLGSADDGERVARFLAAMDRDGLYQRHFAHGEAPNQALLARLALTDGSDRIALLALADDSEVIAHAEYVASGGSGEFALMVLPAFRATGLGRRLLGTLLEVAAAAGQRQITGIAQASNTSAVQLALKQGFRVLPGTDRTTVIVSRELVPRPADFASGMDTGADRQPLPLYRHDTDRTPLYRRPGPRTPLRPRGRQVQRVPADLVGSRQEARGRTWRGVVRTQPG
jgi:GNAT superfamily N-acetyltransferase